MSRWNLYTIATVLVITTTTACAQNSPTTIAIDATANVHPISPGVYGVNAGTQAQIEDLKATVNRYGGNNASMYNWLLNGDNRGSDWYFESLPDARATAGERADTFFTTTTAGGAQPLITIPMIGWVAKLGAGRTKLCSFSIQKYGAQTGSDPQLFPDAGNGISAATNQPITGNDPNDAAIPATAAFQQPWVQHLVNTWGLASAGGLQYYVLDNEPSLWYSTHRDVHSTGAGMAEVFNDTVAYAAAIKAIDPTAQIVGPEEWGWSGYFYSGMDQQYGNTNGWGGALPDRTAHGGWDYVPWLLNALYQHDQGGANRSLDVFSLHFYPQGGEYSSATDTNTELLRNRSTRQLWDPDYVSESWIDTPVYLIPRMQEWLNSYYPGLKTAITEYSWGADASISGATAEADVLGIFGRQGLDMAARWTAPDASTPTYLAMKMYRNYDGAGSGLGDTSVSDTVPNPDDLSSFAAVRSSDGVLTVMVINKVLSGSTPVTINISDYAAGTSARAWQLTSANTIQPLGSVPVAGTGSPMSATVSMTVPAQSITLLAISATPVPTAVILDPSSIVGGKITHGTVTLSAPAPAGGLTIDLASSNAALAQVPATVKAAAGATTAPIRVTSIAVTARSTVEISAKANHVRKQRTLILRP